MIEFFYFYEVVGVITFVVQSETLNKIFSTPSPPSLFDFTTPNAF